MKSNIAYTYNNIRTFQFAQGPHADFQAMLSDIVDYLKSLLGD